MSYPLKNVALVGAGGSLGSAILNAITSSDRFNVRVLRRLGSHSEYATGVDVVDVDFESTGSLKSALAGQHVVVVTIPTKVLGMQTRLIDAAVAAGVQRFIPSGFGTNIFNSKTRKLPVVADKVRIEDYLIEVYQSTSLTYTSVYNGPFLEWGLQRDFPLAISHRKPVIYDSGDVTFSTTTWATVADAVVGILLHPHETKNRGVYIEDTKVSQNDLFAMAKGLSPMSKWEPEYEKIDEAVARSDTRLAQGLVNADTLRPYIYRSLVDPDYGGNYFKTDNELLGLKGLGHDYILELLRQLL